MPLRILHIVDPSTPADAFDMLAQLLPHCGTHRLVALGHRSTKILAEAAGISAPVEWIPSLGWPDPTGWRGLRRTIAQFQPTHLHAWGISGVVAGAVSGFAGRRMATFVQSPTRHELRLLGILDRRATGDGAWTWIASSSSIVRTLLANGLASQRVIRIPPGIRVGNRSSNTPAEVKRELDIAADDGPIILLGGEGRNARHDHGLWAVAILQQIFPRRRAILRDDPRGSIDPGIARFHHTLPANDMFVIAPAEMTWPTLLRAADIFLITADGTIPTGSILAAMASGVPVIGTPIECVSELVAHGHTGLLAKSVKPRAIAARLEEFMNDATLRWPLIDRACADVYEQFSPSAMVEAFVAQYGGPQVPVAAAPGVAL